MAVNTVKRYVRFLEISYQVALLRPLLPTIAARLVKSPKLYWTDPALARVLAERAGAPDGALFETAVLDELLRWLSWQAAPPALSFFRTHAGREVDFLLRAADRLLAFNDAEQGLHQFSHRSVQGRNPRRKLLASQRIAQLLHDRGSRHWNELPCLCCLNEAVRNARPQKSRNANVRI